MTDLTAKLMHHTCNLIPGISGILLSRIFYSTFLLVGLVLTPILEAEHGFGSRGLISTAHAAGETNQSQLATVQANQLDNGDHVVDLQFKGAIPEINHFIMANPPRVIVDILGATNQTNQRILKISKGAIESVMLIGNDKRLRMVINLFEAGQFKADKTSNGYRFHFGQVVQATANNKKAVSQPQKSQAATSIKKVMPAPKTIGNVDFRRTPNGGGRVIVPLANPNIIVDFREQSGELIADFIDANIEDKDERRLDVVDFATPVNSIEIFRHKNNVRVVVVPTGRYKHTVIQNNDSFTLEVSPLTKQEITALEEDESGYSGDTLSLNFQRIPVRAALQVIADFTGFNIITSDSVEGDLSLRLNDVPWDQALDLILQSKNLSMRQKGNVIRIAPSEEINAQEKAEFEALREVTDLEPLVTELIRINYAKAEDIAKLLKSVKAVDTGFKDPVFGSSVTISEIETEKNSLLSARGSVTVDERTNTLLLQDTPVHIREVRELIKELDVPVKQIQIETRIVEATDDFSRSLGARLGFTRITTDARFPGSSDSNSLGTVFGSGNIEATNEVRAENEILYPDALSVNLAADGLSGEAASSYAYQIAKLGSGFLHLLDLEISALQAEGKGKIIANPKLTTTDKHEAHIEQGQERVFNVGSIFGQTIIKEAVLSLTVTPQITPDDNIILDVRITNDSFADTTGNTLNTKQIETQTLLANGETIVIGGIYQQDQSDATIKTPILGDIPLLGNLFKKRTKLDSRTELLIFLTPRIIKSSF